MVFHLLFALSSHGNRDSVAEGQEFPPTPDQNWLESTEKRAQTKVDC